MKQLNLQSQTKEEEAIEFIRKHEPPEGYFLGFSGGKDSVVLYDLTMKSGVKFEAYYTLQIDPPELIKFIRLNYPTLKILKPEYNFWQGILKKCPPYIKKRWCCEIIKEKPSRDIALPHRLIGIRSEESHSRLMKGQICKIHNFKQVHYHPLFNWLEWEIWEYIEQNNLEYCSLYDEGFSRLGCVVCPFITGPTKSAQIKLNLHKARWPQYYRLFEKTMKKFWDIKAKHQRKDTSPQTFEEFLDNWYHGISTIKDKEPYFWNENNIKPR